MDVEHRWVWVSCLTWLDTNLWLGGSVLHIITLYQFFGFKYMNIGLSVSVLLQNCLIIPIYKIDTKPNNGPSYLQKTIWFKILNNSFSVDNILFFGASSYLLVMMHISFSLFWLVLTRGNFDCHTYIISLMKLGNLCCKC